MSDSKERQKIFGVETEILPKKVI